MAYRPLSIRDKSLKVHIEQGKAAGKWPYGYTEFEQQRHAYEWSVRKMAKKWGLKAWSTMRDWWTIDDEDHARENS
jgi:hypothetical protein